MNTDELFIGKLPQPLTKEELNELIIKVSEGSHEARDKLIVHNIRLVLYEVIHRFEKVDYDKRELVSIGIIGLVKAINTYDISKKIKFSTFATKCIDNEILMFLRKLKKEQNVDSIDRIVFYGKDGSELKLEDKLSDDSDLVEDYERNEIHNIIRRLVKELPYRDREIVMLYFGFYNNRIYNQEEIANRLNISRSYVSRLIKENVIKMRKQLEDIGVIELNTKIKENDNKKMRKIQSIYGYFENYTKEQVNEVLSKLTEEEKALITLRYGEDLDNPVQSKLNKEDSYKFYCLLIPKMKRLLANPTGKKKRKREKLEEKKLETTIVLPEVEKPIVDDSKPLIQKQPDFSSKMASTIASSPETIRKVAEDECILKVDLKEEITQVESDGTSNFLTKIDCLKMLELLRTPTFIKMMGVLTVKESIIISLKLGYVDGKYFSTESIAKFLGIEEIEVIETTKKVLLLYKENINNFLDSLIKVATDKNDKKRELSVN